MVAVGLTIFLACICVTAVQSKPSLGTGLCTETLPYADPDNCAKYWVCAPYGPQQMDCAPGTLFNPKIYGCDWPYNVECKPKTTTTTTEEPKTVPPTTTTTTTEATVETTTEKVEPTIEPETETPEPETETPQVETETPEPETEAPEPETETPEPETPDPETETPETETPEPETETPEQATEAPEPEVTESPLDAQCKKYPNKLFLTDNPKCCTQFITCNYGTGIVFDCPAGTYYVPAVSSCTTDSSACN